MPSPTEVFRRCWLAGVAALGVCGAFYGCSPSSEPDLSKARAEALPEVVSFNAHIRPILTAHCTECHGGVKSAGGVSYVYEEQALGYGLSGKRVIEPGNPAGSELIRRVKSEDPDLRMPPADHGEGLTPEEIALLDKWIRQGAQWERHWAYVPPEMPAVPEPETSWGRGALDAFVLARLEARGLAPNPEEAPARLLRRLALDLTGLPPDAALLERFLANPDDTAYANAVDTLLASPHFGERWASMWLDLARYADSMGYERDPYRSIWPYRDWVIRAFNADMPFDRFTREQIAGDLLPEADLDTLVATAFHRNSMTNIEGGTDDEEFRIVSAIDRVNTTWQAWMGTTFACVQCHAHPYDPFPNKSYYRFLDFFNHTVDHDTGGDFPRVRVTLDRERLPELERLQEARMAAERRYLAPFHRLNHGHSWKALEPHRVASTRGIVLSVLLDENGLPYVQTGPNTPKDVIHTVALQPDDDPITAIRIDALMQDGASVADPGDPFVLTYLEAVVRPRGKAPVGQETNSATETQADDAQAAESTIPFLRAAADEAGQMFWAGESLNPDNNSGWAAYPKQHHPRWAIFIPETPILLKPGEELFLHLHCGRGHDGAQQPVLRKFRISASEDTQWTTLAHAAETLAALEDRQAAIDAISAMDTHPVPVMRERRPDLRRSTHVFHRGDWRNKQEAVTAGTPDLLHPMPTDQPADRRALADWLVAPDNPLTARVTVNRIWAQLFGTGIVKTVEDFGSSGIPPTHPRLLDYLAIRFRDAHGWSIKGLLKEIVLSATYRQSAAAPPEKRAADPDNRWLSRGPRNRLTAEMIRDNALAVSGLLSRKQFGPPVMPEQPEGVWRVVYNKATWETSEGEDRYRRAVYTHWKRSATYPSFVTFDAPSRDVCEPRRFTTNTPLQALVMMNDPVYLECARQLARRSWQAAGGDPARAIATAFRAALMEPPGEATLADLLDLYHEALAAYRQDPGLLASAAGESEDPDPGLAAMKVTSHAILNLDAFLTR